MTKSREIYEYLKQTYKSREDISPEDIKKLAQEKGVSKALVYKMINRLENEGFWQIRGETIKAKEPIIKIEPEPPKEIPKEEIEFEIPRELIEEEKPTTFEVEIPTTTEAPTPTEITIQPPPIGFKPEDIEFMFHIGFKKLADLTGFEGWKLEPEESKRLGEIWAPILNEQSSPIAQYIPYISAIIATIIIVVPRIYAYRQWQQEKIKKEIEEHPIAEKIPKESEAHEPTPEELERKKQTQKPAFLKKLT